MRSGLLIVIFFAFTGSLQGQPLPDSVLTVSGTIVDEKGKPVSLATVALFDRRDSLQKGSQLSNDKGYFSVETAPGNYFLKITYQSYREQIIPDILVINKDIELGTVSMVFTAKMLEEVVVRAEKPQMRLELDKRVYNVGKDLSNIGGTASDVLGNVPSITVDVDGTVNLRGSQNVRILINGRPSALTSTADALRQLPANLIESIEVITNPSSRYEAEGEAGIINIILKKNTLSGLNGVLTVNGGYPAAYGGSLNLNYRMNKFNFFTTYGIDYRSTPGKGTSFQQLTDDDTSFAYQQDREITRSGLSHTLIAGLDYFANERNTLTASFLFNPSNSINKSQIVYKDFDGSGSLKQTVTRNEREDEEDKDMEASLMYRKTTKRKGELFTADIKFVWEDEVEITDYEQGIGHSNDKILQNAENLAHEQSLIFQSDYVREFANKGKFETGVRASAREIQNDYLLQEKTPGNGWVVLPAFENNMVYTERIYAAYLMGGRQFGKWSLQGGARAEYSDITTRLVKTGERNHRDYFNIFPSANASYAINDANTLQMSYSYRINRPRYRDLLPYSDFSDLRSFFKGNPDLNPEFTHSIEAGHLVNWENGNFLTNFYFRHRNGVIQRITTIDSTGVANIFPVNLSTQNAYGLELNLALSITSWWRLNSNINLYRALTEGEYKGEDLSSDAFSGSSRTSTKITMFRKWEFQAAFNYRAPEKTTQGKTLATYFMDAGFAGDIMKGKATLSFNVRDLFNTRKRRMLIEDDGYYSQSDFQWRSRQFMVSFNYRLNRMKEKQQQEREGGEEGDF